MSAPKAAEKRVVDMTPAERRGARERAGIRREALAAPCYINARTIDSWERGVPPRSELAWRCYITTLQNLLDAAAAEQ